MKYKFILVVIFIAFKISTVSAQFIPNSYSLNYQKYKKEIAKTSSSIADNGIGDIITIGDTLWVGTGTGVSHSTDRGATWTNFAVGSESAIGYYKGMFWIATAYTKNTSVGPTPTGTGLSYTTDNGKNWAVISQPIDDGSDSVVVYGIDTLKALPVIVTEQNVIFDMTFTPGTIWIASWAGGVRRAPIDSLIADTNYRWNRVILPLDNMNSIKPTDTLNFSYNVRNNNNLLGFSILAINDSTIYAGTAGGLNVTTNANNLYPSWKKFNHTNENNSLSGNWIKALAYNYTDHSIWAATWKADGENEFNAASFSTNNGNTWQTTLDQQDIWNFSIKENQVIAPSDAGAFRTSDNGKNWILPNTIIDANTKISILPQSFYAAAFQGTSVWLGSGDGLACLDEIGGMWQGNWKVLFASQPLASSNDTYAYPNPFNPMLDVLKIKYSTAGQMVPVTIRILNFGMHIIRTVIQNAERGSVLHNIDNNGGVIDNWDGRDQNGRVVPNGVYFYRVDTGGMKPAYGKIIVLH